MIDPLLELELTGEIRPNTPEKELLTQLLLNGTISLLPDIEAIHLPEYQEDEEIN